MVNLVKCEFSRVAVMYLDKVVGQGQVQPVYVKVCATDCFLPPTSKRELMWFLGIVGYYRNFCELFCSGVSIN